MYNVQSFVTLCLWQVNRFLSKILTDNAAATRWLDTGWTTIFMGLMGRCSLSPHVSLTRPALSCAHYFQAPAMQAKEHVSTVQKEQLSTWKYYNGMEWCVLVTHWNPHTPLVAWNNK